MKNDVWVIPGVFEDLASSLSHKEQTMSAGKKVAGSGTPGDSSPDADPRAAGKAAMKDMEYAIDMLRVKLHSETNLSEKIRLYNQIKTLQDNISRLRSEG
jgi:hypothetical protein